MYAKFPLLAGLFATLALQAPTAEASHKHNSSCTHNKSTVVVSHKTYSNQPSHNHNHSSTSVVVVSPSPAPVVTYRYYPYYGYRRYYYTTPAPAPTYAQPPQQQQKPQPRFYNETVREVGARFIGGGSVEGDSTAVVGAGAYLRLRNTGRFVGFEASVDSTAILDESGNALANQVPLQGAALVYLNPRSPLRVYGLVGGGVTLEQNAFGASQALTAQAGGGFDLDITQRASMMIDFRGITNETTNVAARAASPTSGTNVVMNMGLSFKF